MTVSTVKSVNITNIESNPTVPLNKKVGRKNIVLDKIALATTSLDEIGDIILAGTIPSNAIITSIKVLNDDLDSNATPTIAFDLGLYYSGKGGNQLQTGKVSGTVVDADCFATAATTLQAANVTPVELRFERVTGTADIVDITKEAWEVAGLSTDCGGLLYIGLTLTAVAATAAAGDLVVIVDYI